MKRSIKFISLTIDFELQNKRYFYICMTIKGKRINGKRNSRYRK